MGTDYHYPRTRESGSVVTDSRLEGVSGRTPPDTSEIQHPLNGDPSGGRDSVDASEKPSMGPRTASEVQVATGGRVEVGEARRGAYSMEQYTVQATVSRTRDGWASMRHVPTFPLPTDSGSMRSAATVAARVIDPYEELNISMCVAMGYHTISVLFVKGQEVTKA